MSTRAALMEQAVAAAQEAAMFRVTNGSSSPPNGHAVRGEERMSNGRSAGLDPHHLVQVSERFDRTSDRVYSSLEKEVSGRNGATHGKILMSSSAAASSSYPDVLRSYSEDSIRESEEEWRNIHTVSYVSRTPPLFPLLLLLLS